MVKPESDINLERLRNTLNAVTTARTKLLQHYLQMEIDSRFGDDSWKRILHDDYEDGINGDHPGQYIGAYKKMNEIGVANYKVTDMDTTILITEIGYSRLSTELGISGATRRVLKGLQIGRNCTAHSSANETMDELYARCRDSIDTLRDFTDAVCKHSKAESGRISEFRQYAMRNINELGSRLEDAYAYAQSSEDVRLSPFSSWTRMFMRKPCDCPACKGAYTMVLNRKRTLYRCMSCGLTMTRKERMKGTLWFCDGCDAFMNIQQRFDPGLRTWTCTECGLENNISDENEF